MKVRVLLISAVLLMTLQAQAAPVADATAPSKITVAANTEPGERLVVAGTVRGPDGKALRGVSIYVYHTDVNGLYTPGEKNDNGNPRIKGFMRSDANGRYEFDTIMPGYYPDTVVPRHIHFVAVAPGFKQRDFEIMFDGDPKVGEKERADAAKPYSWVAIVTDRKGPDGTRHCTADIALEPM